MNEKLKVLNENQNIIKKVNRQEVLLAVNGTLMRGLKLEKNLTNVNAKFLYEAKTENSYRLWSINDENPAMIRVNPMEEPSSKIDVEVWSVPVEGLAEILTNEPEGLSIGKVKLDNNSIVLGVIGEPVLVKGMKEITSYGGWRNYINSNA